MKRSLLWAVTLAVISSPLGAQTTAVRAVRPPTPAESMRMFTQVMNQLRVNHADSLDTHTLLMAAIEGMVHAADPHSYVLPALRLSPDRQAAYENGELYPVPITFAYFEDAPTVVGVHAAGAGPTLDVHPGDELIAIDSRPVTAESAAELDILLAGAAGTTVMLTLRRQRMSGSVVILKREVERQARSALPAVMAARLLEENTGYIRLAHFDTEYVGEEFRDALSQLEGDGMTRLVLDLRDNGGGRLDQAADVVGEFLPEGVVVYVSEGRRARDNDTVRVVRSTAGRFELPVVVLVNSATASAAELIAGALQDHDRALIVGTPTFGKSLFMRGFPLTDGSMLMLVVGKIRTPCGRVVQRPYRNLRRRDYFLTAGMTPDTTALPACRTASGRTVYGGGGIHPDVVQPANEPSARWVEAVREREILLQWMGRALSDTLAVPGMLDDYARRTRLPMPVVKDFVRFAAAQGIDIPTSAVEDPQLHYMLMLTIVWGRWGPRAFYEVAAGWDAGIAFAVAEFPRAESLVPNR